MPPTTEAAKSEPGKCGSVGVDRPLPVGIIDADGLPADFIARPQLGS